MSNEFLGGPVTNRMGISGVVLVAAAVLWAGAANAQTAIGNPVLTGGSCYYVGNAGNTGQTFVVPSGVSSVRSVSIGAGWVNSSPSNFRIGLRTTPGGAELFGANVSTTNNYSNAPATQVLTIPAGGYSVTPGQTLFISVTDATGNTAACYSANYIAGAAYNTGALTPGDTAFRVIFNDTPPPAPVPTLSEWAMILFGTILAGGAALYIQRRQNVV